MKFAAALLLLDLVPLAAFSITMFLAFRDSLSRFSLQNVERIADYQAGVLDSAVKAFDAVTIFIYQYRTWTPNGLADIIGSREGSESPRGSGAIDAYLRALLYASPPIRAVSLVARDGRTYQMAREDKAFRIGFDYRAQPWFARISEAGKSLCVVPPRKDSAYSRSDETVITFGRNYYDLSTILSDLPERSPAVVLVDVDAKYFSRMLSGLDQGKDGAYRLIDTGGRLVAGAIEAPSDKDAYLISRSLGACPWRLDIYVAKAAIRQRMGSVGLFLAAGTAICALGILALAVAFSRMFSRPLEGILSSIEGIESGNFDVVVPVESSDEFGVLASSFNAMTIELKSYIGREYLARLGRKEAELDALRSRLKPHFLANTLEVIRMAAVDAGDGTAAEMIRALSAQLGYTLDEGEDEVPLRRELEMAQDYYFLLSTRKKGAIELDIDVPAELLEARSPKLLVQPLVENAMIHGLGPRQWKGTVRISASASDGRLELCVFDDGVGIEAKRLAAIRSVLERCRAEDALDGSFPGAGFLGIGGMQLRLRLRYGAEAGIDIESQEGIGTVVRATLPLEFAEDHEL